MKTPFPFIQGTYVDTMFRIVELSRARKHNINTTRN